MLPLDFLFLYTVIIRNIVNNFVFLLSDFAALGKSNFGMRIQHLYVVMLLKFCFDILM